MSRDNRIIIKGGTVVIGQETQMADVTIDDGLISAIEPKASLSGSTVIEAEGCWVLPGLVDLHTHLREPGNEEAETIESGTRSAIMGGYSAVVAMPNTTPTTDNAQTVKWVIDRAKQTALCDVIVAAAITKDRANEELVDMRGLHELGVRLFTNDGANGGLQDGALMKQALLIARELGDVVAEHCEDHVVADGGSMNAGAMADKLGLRGMPSEAEELMVMRDIALARATGAHIHFLHVSTARAVAMVREAKRAGVNVTAEATPHHFTLTEEALSTRNTSFKVNPPLRREQDRVSVLNGLRDGTLDIIATDHAPHKAADKLKTFADAPPGMVGLETAAALAITELDLTAVQLAQLMSTRPAHIAQVSDRHGLIAPQRAANISVIDPAAAWVVEANSMATKGRNTPYEGMKLSGMAVHTIVNGELLLKDGVAQR